MQEKVGIQISLSGDGSGIKAVVTGARRDFDSLARSGADAGGKITSSFGATRAGLQSVSEQLAQSRRELIGFFSVQYAAGKAEQLIGIADAAKTIDARLRLATTSTDDYNRASSELFAIAQRTRAPLESTVDLYSKLAPSFREAGRSQGELLQVTESVAQAMKLSGSSTGAANAAIVQFAQAMSSGVLRGDEFNSINEQGGRLMQALADGMGVARGELRKMAEQGKLTADVVLQALGSQAEKLEDEYSQLPQRVGDAVTQMQNKFLAQVGAFDQATGITTALAESIGFVSDHLVEVGQALAVVAAMVAGRYTASMVAAAAAQLGQIEASRIATVQSLHLVKVKEAEAIAFLASTQAVYANTVGFARLAAAERVYAAQRAATAAAEATAAVAAANAARTMKTLGSALAFLGGPAGIIFGATAALALWVSGSEDAAQKTSVLTAETDGLAGAMQNMSRTQAQVWAANISEEISKRSAAVAGYRRGLESIDHAKHAQQVTLLNNSIASETARIAELEGQLKKLNDTQAAAALAAGTEEWAKGEAEKAQEWLANQEKEKAAYAQHLTQRLEQLRKAQMSEAQVEAQRYIDGKATLDESLKARTIQREEYSARLIQLEEDTQARLLEIADKSAAASGQVVDGNSHVAAYEEYKKGLLDRVEALRQTTLTEAQIEAERYIAQQSTLDAATQRGVDVQAMREQLEIDHQQRMQRIVQDGLNEQSSIEKYHADVVQQVRAGAVQNGMQLMQVFANRSKAAAMAVLALEKALGISSVLINSKVAAMKALAQLGPIAGAGVAASITTAGYVSAGLIAATGLAQAYQMNTGGISGASPVYSASPVTGTPSGSYSGGAQSPGAVLQVNMWGVYNEKTLRDDVIPAIADLVNANDIQIVNINSRNGQDLIAASRGQ